MNRTNMAGSTRHAGNGRSPLPIPSGPVIQAESRPVGAVAAPRIIRRHTSPARIYITPSALLREHVGGTYTLHTCEMGGTERLQSLMSPRHTYTPSRRCP